MSNARDGQSLAGGAEAPADDVDFVVREIVGTVSGHEVDQISASMELIGELGIESAQMLNALMMIEERFEILIEEDEIVAILTVGDLIDVVRGKLRSDMAPRGDQG